MITGCHGQLGNELQSILKSMKSEIGPIPEQYRGAEICAVDIDTLDITDTLAVTEFVKSENPDIIINCAAMTNVDGCETMQDVAYKVNAAGVRNLARAAKAVNAKFIHVSTDYVFAGNGTKYENRGFGNGGTYHEFHFEGGDMGDIFGSMFGGMFGSRSDSGFRQENSQGQQNGWNRNNTGNRQTAWNQGSNLQSDITVSFEDAALGCDKVIRLQSMDGSDKIQDLKVHIPAGIEDGKSIRLRGRGMPGNNGGAAGDLLLKVHIREKPGYERRGMDVYTTVQIPFTTAVFGGEAQVQTLYGSVMCRIPEGTQSGSKIRLKGKGIVSMKDPGVKGDQYVTIQIQVPARLSPEERQKLKEYDQICKKQSEGGHRRGAA